MAHTHLEELAPRMARHHLLEAGHKPPAAVQGLVVGFDASHHGHLGTTMVGSAHDNI